MNPQAILFAAAILPSMALSIAGPLLAVNWLRKRSESSSDESAPKSTPGAHGAGGFDLAHV